MFALKNIWIYHEEPLKFFSIQSGFWGFGMLDEVADFVLSFSKFSWLYGNQRGLWEPNFHKKWTYGLGIMKHIVLLPDLSNHKNLYF